MQDTYHSDVSRDSHSSLQMFRASIELYAAVRVHKTKPPKEPTPEMLFGSAFHMALLEPMTSVQRLAVAPECDRRTTAGKATWAEFVSWAENDHYIMVTQDDYQRILAMTSAVRRNRWASSVLDATGNVFEQPVEWDDVIPMKCRPDIRMASGLIADVKTTNDVDPEQWSMTMAKFGYHRQAALYLDGCREAHGSDGPFVHIVVSKEPPHEVAVYEVGAASVALGRRENQETMLELKMRRDNGDWSGRWSQDLNSVELPSWYFRKAV